MPSYSTAIEYTLLYTPHDRLLYKEFIHIVIWMEAHFCIWTRVTGKLCESLFRLHSTLYIITLFSAVITLLFSAVTLFSAVITLLLSAVTLVSAVITLFSAVIILLLIFVA